MGKNEGESGNSNSGKNSGNSDFSEAYNREQPSKNGNLTGSCKRDPVVDTLPPPKPLKK